MRKLRKIDPVTKIMLQKSIARGQAAEQIEDIYFGNIPNISFQQVEEYKKVQQQLKELKEKPAIFKPTVYSTKTTQSNKKSRAQIYLEEQEALQATKSPEKQKREIEYKEQREQYLRQKEREDRENAAMQEKKARKREPNRIKKARKLRSYRENLLWERKKLDDDREKQLYYARKEREEQDKAQLRQAQEIEALKKQTQIDREKLIAEMANEKERDLSNKLNNEETGGEIYHY